MQACRLARRPAARANPCACTAFVSCNQCGRLRVRRQAVCKQIGLHSKPYSLRQFVAVHASQIKHSKRFASCASVICKSTCKQSPSAVHIVFALMHAASPAPQAQVFLPRCAASLEPEKVPPATKKRCNQKLFRLCGVLTTSLAKQALARVSRSLPNFGTEKSFVPYVRCEINLLISKGIACNPTPQAQN